MPAICVLSENHGFDEIRFMQVIKLIDALRLMEEVSQGARVRFDIKGTKYNRKQKTGGGVYHYRNAQLPYNLNPKPSTQSTSEAGVASNRNPNHYKNATRNIQLDGVKEIKKVNIWLIEQITFHNTGITYQVIH